LGGVVDGNSLTLAGVAERVAESRVIVAPVVNRGPVDFMFARDGGDGSASKQAGEYLGLKRSQFRHENLSRFQDGTRPPNPNEGHFLQITAITGNKKYCSREPTPVEGAYSM
jgi:hypothetical protein